MYDTCPSCGEPKHKQAKLCNRCRLQIRNFIQQPDDQSSRFIPLTQGQYAIVRTELYEWLMQWKWYAHWDPVMKSFYAARNDSALRAENHHVIWMHRQILGLEDGDPRQGDHALHNTLDNREYVDGRENLRIATPQENNWNQCIRKNNTTGYKWVSKFREAYRFQIRVTGKRIESRGFKTPKEAYDAACIVAAENHKQFMKVD
jgi:hypothetical protein